MRPARDRSSEARREPAARPTVFKRRGVAYRNREGVVARQNEGVLRDGNLVSLDAHRQPGHVERSVILPDSTVLVFVLYKRDELAGASVLVERATVHRMTTRRSNR